MLQIDADEEAGVTITHSSLRLLLLRGETGSVIVLFFFWAVTAGDSPRMNPLQCVFTAALNQV